MKEKYRRITDANDLWKRKTMWRDVRLILALVDAKSQDGYLRNDTDLRMMISTVVRWTRAVVNRMMIRMDVVELNVVGHQKVDLRIIIVGRLQADLLIIVVGHLGADLLINTTVADLRIITSVEGLRWADRRINSNVAEEAANGKAQFIVVVPWVPVEAMRVAGTVHLVVTTVEGDRIAAAEGVPLIGVVAAAVAENEARRPAVVPHDLHLLVVRGRLRRVVADQAEVQNEN